MPHTLSVLVAALAVTSNVLAQEDGPLAEKRFNYPDLPFKADRGSGERGPQFGYNICNSTTEGPESLCQTAFVNSIQDFCLWGAPEPNSIVGDTEGESVAYCTQPGRGTRLIPQGTLTGVRFARTPDYIQVWGTINQVGVNIQANDDGGEMDPHGADRRGNPIGGLVFSNAFPSNGGQQDRFQQVVEWHNFMGANVFCFKACDQSRPNAARYCEHIYDRVGCNFNAPGPYVAGEFISCDSDNQDFPGIYTDAAGQIQTYTQPPEGTPITTLPFVPRIPASSNCQTFTSAQLFSALPQPSAPLPGSSSARPSASTTRASSAAGGSSRPATSGRASNTASSSATATQSQNAAVGQAEGIVRSAAVGVAAIVGLVGVGMGLFML